MADLAEVLICSVGGSPEPIRKSINQQQPRYVIYVASLDSRKNILKDIMCQLEWHGIEDTHTITLSNFQDLPACVRDIRSGIATGIQAMGLGRPEECPLIADITGGTKVMSAALTLVMMEYDKSRFAYIGGDGHGARSKNGLGVVESGHEVLIRRDNPWEIMAVREVRSLADFFNAGNCAAALSIAQKLAQNIPDKEKFYGGVADLIQAYVLWDAFDHKKAFAKLKQATGRLKDFAANNPLVAHLLDTFLENQKVLERIQQDAQNLRASKPQYEENSGHDSLCDLLANAARRAKAGRYDGAVARLYSAIEKCAKIRLMKKYGIDNSRIVLDDLPDRIPADCRERLRSVQGEDGTIRIGLEKSFELLEALQDPLGERFLRQQAALKQSLETRNLSLLAHGYNPVKQEVYDELFRIALDFLEVQPEALPQFPRMEWKSLIL